MSESTAKSIEQTREAAHLEVWRPAGMSVTVLSGGCVSIGRCEERDVVLDHDGQVSSLHAILQSYGSGWTIRDLGSRNGTLVAGEVLIGERSLRHGDNVLVGQTYLVFRNSRAVTSPTHTPENPKSRDARKPLELTRREFDVLRELCRPLCSSDPFRVPADTKKIATTLVVSEAAVKYHLSHMYEKFELDPAPSRRRRVELANEALRRKILGPGDFN